MPSRFNFLKKKKKPYTQPFIWDTVADHPPYIASDKAVISTPPPSDPEGLRLFHQPQSWFCTLLPREIRILIFEYVLGDHVIHLGFHRQSKKVLPQTPRTRHDRISPTYIWENHWWHDFCKGECRWYFENCSSPMTFWKTYQGWAQDSIKIDKGSKIDLALLAVCRKLYFEAFFVLYTRNVFDFVRPKILMTHLSKLWTPSHLQLLRSISMTWYMSDLDYPHKGTSRNSLSPATLEILDNACLEYDKFWGTLAGLPGLSVLRVALNTIPMHSFLPEILDRSPGKTFPRREMMTAWLGPIDRFKNKKLSQFELAIGSSWAEVIWGRERIKKLVWVADTALNAAPVQFEGLPFVLVAFNDRLPSVYCEPFCRMGMEDKLIDLITN